MNTKSESATPAEINHKNLIVDAAIRKANDEQGIILINIGNGKGKSSAAFGMIARSLGHSMRVGIVQFVKGDIPTGEEKFFRQCPQVDYRVVGENLGTEVQGRLNECQAIALAWDHALRMLNNPNISLVLLDELNVALKYNYLDTSHVIRALEQRPCHQHVIITGQAAKPELIEIADTVTDMREIKHAFKSGGCAQKGIER